MREGELLCTQTLEQARGTFLDRNGRAANYATLCERVNALGVALADLKTQHAALQHDKHVCHAHTRPSRSRCLGGARDYHEAEGAGECRGAGKDFRHTAINTVWPFPCWVSVR